MIAISLIEELLVYGKTILTEKELQQVIKEAEYGLFHQTVEKLLAEGILAPVKASGLNGCRLCSTNTACSNPRKIIRDILHPSGSLTPP